MGATTQPAHEGTLPFRQGISGSRWELFEESSHMAHAEEPERYMQVLDGHGGAVDES